MLPGGTGDARQDGSTELLGMESPGQDCGLYQGEDGEHQVNFPHEEVTPPSPPKLTS